MDEYHTSESCDYSLSDISPKGSSDHRRQVGGMPDRVGAYGLRLGGLEDAHRLLTSGDRHGHELHIDATHGSRRIAHDHLDEAKAHYRLQSGGALLIDRSRAHAQYVFHHEDALPTDEELVHPYLFAAAATINHWLDRHTFHAGAFVHGDGAWIVAGAKEAGKSSILAQLAIRGLPVLSDDLVVVDGDDVLAGPTCIDLRPDAARHLGVGEDIGIVGIRPRWRYMIPATSTRVPIRGWVFPQWDRNVTVTRLASRDRLRALFANQALRVPPRRPHAMLTLAAAPGYVFGRPRRWWDTDRALDQLLTTLPS